MKVTDGAGASGLAAETARCGRSLDIHSLQKLAGIWKVVVEIGSE